MDFIRTFRTMDVNELRTQVINLLKQSYADGRITVDSLERRLKEATGAVSKEELLTLVTDIPESRDEQIPSGSDGRNEHDWNINDRVPRESQSFFNILGGSTRTGRWQPARQINCLSLMGGIKLDFREADFPREGVKVNAGCIMGSVEIILPPGINADISGLPLLGSMNNKSGRGDEGAPAVSVRGVAIMGSVEIKRKELRKPKKNGFFGNNSGFGRKSRRRS